MRSLPLLLVLVYFAIAVGWRSWLQARRHGTWGIALSQARATDIGAALLPVLLVADAAIAPVGYLWPGTLFVLASLALMIAAQLHLGASWRIGIDPDARPGLVTSGLYASCRNPIFACAFVGLLGFVLLLPNVFTIALVLTTLAGIHRQVRAEEAYLGDLYGAAYSTYLARVPRYLPR